MQKLENIYRDYLKEELERRSRRNPSYSLRAFAKDLGFSSSRLSHVMNGRYGLSMASAGKVADRLHMDPVQKDYFCTVVQAVHARSQCAKNLAIKKIKSKNISYQSLRPDHFHSVSDWYHLTILELIHTKNWNPSPVVIAARLNISVHEAVAAIGRLHRLKMLEKDENGNIKSAGQYFTNPEDIPNEAVKEYHRQILSKASEAVTHQSTIEREFQSLTLSFDIADLPLAKKMIQDFQNEFEEKFASSVNKTEVYSLSQQFFKLTK